MKIRREQIEVFEEARLPAFEDEMVEHLKEFTPMHSEVLGEEGIRPIIQLGMERAKKYGWTHKGPVRFYIELFFMLGVDFDTDPQFPWTRQLLADPSVPDQTERADRLHAKVMDYIEVVGGPSREYAKRALSKAKALPFEGTPVSSADFENEVIRRMNTMHPEKCSYVGEKPLRSLIPHALKQAQQYSVTSDAGVALFIGLMFALGHGVITDPKYPFIERTLKNTRFADPAKRAERAYAKIMTYLDHVQHLEG